MSMITSLTRTPNQSRESISTKDSDQTSPSPTLVTESDIIRYNIDHQTSTRNTELDLFNTLKVVLTFVFQNEICATPSLGTVTIRASSILRSIPLN